MYDLENSRALRRTNQFTNIKHMIRRPKKNKWLSSSGQWRVAVAALLAGAALVTTTPGNAATVYQSGSPVAATSRQYALDAESYRLAKAVVKDLSYPTETYRAFLESLNAQEIENSELAAAIVEYYEHFVHRSPQKDDRHRAIIAFGDSEAPQDEDLKPFHARCEEIMMDVLADGLRNLAE